MNSLSLFLTPMFLGLVGDFANAVAGAIATIIFGIFGLVAQAITGVVASEIATPLMNVLSKTPLPTRGSSLALFRPPTNGHWQQVYHTHQSYMGAALILGIFFYIILNFVNTLPYVSEHFRQKARGALPKMIIAVALSWPFTVFILGFADGMINLFRPNPTRFAFLISNIIVGMAAASAGPWAIITVFLSLIPVSLILITIAIYAARWIVLLAVPMIMPIILVGKVSGLPVVSDICDSVLNLFIKMAIAPAFVMLAFKAGTMIFVQGGPGSPGGGSMSLTTLGGGGVEQMMAFGLGILIPFVGIFGMYFVIQSQVGIGGMMAMRGLKRATGSAAASAVGTGAGATAGASALDAANTGINKASGGEHNWESVAQRRNAVKAGSRAASATRGAAHSVRNDPIGAAKSGTKSAAETIGSGINRATKGDAGKAYSLGKSGVSKATAAGAGLGSTIAKGFSRDPPDEIWDKNINKLRNSRPQSPQGQEALHNLIEQTEEMVQSASGKGTGIPPQAIVDHSIKNISKETELGLNETEQIVNTEAQAIDAYEVSRLTEEHPEADTSSGGGGSGGGDDLSGLGPSPPPGRESAVGSQSSVVPPGQGDSGMIGPTEGEENITKNQADDIMQDSNTRRQQFEEQFQDQNTVFSNSERNESESPNSGSGDQQ